VRVGRQAARAVDEFLMGFSDLPRWTPRPAPHPAPNRPGGWFRNPGLELGVRRPAAQGEV